MVVRLIQVIDDLARSRSYIRFRSASYYKEDNPTVCPLD